MPLYEYECAQCGCFERIRKFSDPPLTACPTCGREVQKLLSSPAIQFKGSGWYITDYARKGNGGNASGSKADPGKETRDTKESKDTKEGSSSSKSSESTSSSPQSSTSKDSSASGSSSSK